MMLEESQLIPIEFRFKLSKLEIKALNLMRYYERLRRIYCHDVSYMLFSRKNNPTLSRFFNSFLKLATKSETPETVIPNPELFIKSQFEILKSEFKENNTIYCPPQFLFSKYAWRRYTRYINQIHMENNIRNSSNKKTKSNKINIIRELKETKKFLKEFYINNYGSDKIDYHELLRDSRVWLCILNKTISPYFLAISRTFPNIVIPKEIRREIPENFDIYKKEVVSDASIIKIAKKLFKDEFNG